MLGAEALYRALGKCPVGSDQISQVAQRLVRPPLSLRPVFNEPLHFDRDGAARLLHLDEGRPDPEAKWKALSRAERKRAKRLWDWTGSNHGLSVTLQGRPPIIDAALVLYCIRVLCEASGLPEFKFSRPADGGALGGPMWQALIEALPIAQQFLARRYGTPVICRSKINDHAETIAGIVKLTRTKHFKDLCRELGLGSGCDDIAHKPSEFRLAIACTRKSRSRTRPHQLR